MNTWIFYEGLVDIILSNVESLGIGVFLIFGYRSLLKWLKELRANDQARLVAIDERFEKMDKRFEAIDERFKGVALAQISLLHDVIYDRCQTYLERGYITVIEMDNLNVQWKAYSALGGNGTGEILYNRVKQLKIRED